MKVKLLSSIAFVLFTLFSSSAWALPVNGLKLHIQTLGDRPDKVPAPKIIDIDVKGNGVQVSWFSLLKAQDPDAPYPTLKVKANRGVIASDNFDGKYKLFHPNLWGSGYTRLGESLPLWLSPEYLKTKSRKTKRFELGLLNSNRLALKTAPKEYYEKVLFFQSLYQQLVEYGAPKKVLDRSDSKQVKDFLEEYFQISVMKKAKHKVLVNGSQQELKVKQVGNNYYQFTVLDDDQNPLILKFEVFAKKSPKVFRKYFDALKDKFEYRVTQVQY